MICVQRVHRIVVALMIIASIGMMHAGYFFEGTYLLLFISILMIVWAIFDFCPLISILRKILPNCSFRS